MTSNDGDLRKTPMVFLPADCLEAMEAELDFHAPQTADEDEYLCEDRHKATLDSSDAFHSARVP